jgi:hypothetical protein
VCEGTAPLSAVKNYFLISNFRRVLNAVFFYFVISRRLNFLCRYLETYCSIFVGRLITYEDGTSSVKKGRHRKFIRRGMTPKKEYSDNNDLFVSARQNLKKPHY